MALTDAFPGAPGVADTVDLRKDLAGLIVRDTAGNPRPGVFPRHANALVTARASMGVDVAQFEAALVRGGGPLFIANDGSVTVPIGAAPSSNSRYNIVYAKQNESGAPFTDANNSPTFGFVAGTAAAAPDLAAAIALVPTGGLPLAAVLVPSTATTTQSAGVVITQLFTYTAAAGGTVLVRNQAERDAFAWIDSQQLFRLDTRADEVRDGSGWLVYDSVPQTYTPAFSGASPLGLGTGAVVSGDYFRRGKLVRVRIGVIFGADPISIGPGSLSLSLPLPSASRSNGHRIAGQYYYGPEARVFPAWLWINNGSSGAINVPINTTSVQMGVLNMGSAAGAGVPAVAGKWGIGAASNLLFEGEYEAA